MHETVLKQLRCGLGVVVLTAWLAACGRADTGARPAAGAAAGNAAAGVALALENGDFEQTASSGTVPGWLVMQHAGVPSYEMAVEPAAAYRGQGGFRMTRTHPQYYGTLAQDIALPQPPPAELELSAMLKTRDVGALGWKLVAIAGGAPAYSAALTGTTDWQPVILRVKPAPGATSVRVGVTLLDAGTGYADDVQLKAIAP